MLDRRSRRAAWRHSTSRAAFRAVSGTTARPGRTERCGQDSLVAALAGVRPGRRADRLGHASCSTAAGCRACRPRRAGSAWCSRTSCCSRTSTVRDNVAFGARMPRQRPCRGARGGADPGSSVSTSAALAAAVPARALRWAGAARRARPRARGRAGGAPARRAAGSSLDVEVRDEVRDDLAGWLRGFPGPVIVVTHDADDLLGARRRRGRAGARRRDPARHARAPGGVPRHPLRPTSARAVTRIRPPAGGRVG